MVYEGHIYYSHIYDNTWYLKVAVAFFTYMCSNVGSTFRVQY